MKEKIVDWVNKNRKDIVVVFFLAALSLIVSIVLLCCIPVDDVFGIAAIIPGGIFLLCLAYYINHCVANEFSCIAYQKGYADKKYYWYSFFLGIAGYLMVVALPKKK